MTGPPGRHFTVLLAAVPAAVAAVAAEALRPHSLLLLRVVPDLDALRSLQPAPDLILVGRGADDDAAAALLRVLKHDPACRTLPVLVGAQAWPEPMLQAHYGLHANACLTWPEGENTRAWLARIARFWLGGGAVLAAAGGA